MSRNIFRRLVLVVLAAVMMAGLFLVDSSAQRRRRRRHRPAAPRITNPAIYQPPASDNANTGAETGTENPENANSNQNTRPPANESDPESMKRTIRTLSSQVDRLNDKLGQMEESQRSLVDLERLSRAEQRATSLRAELRDVQTKEADLQARADDVDYALKPENIERSVAGYGTTRPEEVREQRRRTLQNEKDRISKQLDQLASSRMHLEQAIAAADVEIERLHKRLDAADQVDIENAKTKEQTTETSPPPRATSRPSPSPYPPR